jgi:hypothetical protein
MITIVYGNKLMVISVGLIAQLIQSINMAIKTPHKEVPWGKPLTLVETVVFGGMGHISPPYPLSHRILVYPLKNSEG